MISVSVFNKFHPAGVFELSGPILDIGGMGAFLRANFSKIRAFGLLAPPKQMLFLTIFNENIFFKTQGTRLGATVTPNKG